MSELCPSIEKTAYSLASCRLRGLAPMGMPCLCRVCVTVSRSSLLYESKSNTLLTTFTRPSLGNFCTHTAPPTALHRHSATTYTDNTALPTFARHTPAVPQSIDIACKPALESLLLWAHAGTDGHHTVTSTLLCILSEQCQ